MIQSLRSPFRQIAFSDDQQMIIMIIMIMMIITVIVMVMVIVIVIVIVVGVIVTRSHNIRYNYGRQGNPLTREGRMLAPVRPRLQAAGLQCLKLQIALAFPNPHNRSFPGTHGSFLIRRQRGHPVLFYPLSFLIR